MQKEAIDKGAWLEYVASTIALPIFREQEPKELAAWIDELGADRLVLCSTRPVRRAPHPEGLPMPLPALLSEGVPYDEREKMTKRNRALLLGRDP